MPSTPFQAQGEHQPHLCCAHAKHNGFGFILDISRKQLLAAWTSSVVQRWIKSPLFIITSYTGLGGCPMWGQGCVFLLCAGR